MNQPAKSKLWRWLPRAAWSLLAGIAVVIILVESGVAERWMRRAVVAQIERMTGGSVELGQFRFHAWTLRAELDNLTVHGREPAGTPPFFRADSVLLAIRIVSFLSRRVALDEARFDRPAVHIRFEKDGHNNVPEPKAPRASQKPLQEQLFELSIRRLRWNDGALYWNDVRVPLAAESGDFHFALDFVAPAPGRESYRGNLSWQKVKMAARRYLPFDSDVAAKFTLGRDQFALESFSWKLPASELNVSAELPSFARNDWTFRYGARLDFEDIRIVTRKPHVPSGKAGFGGSGEYRDGKLTARGNLSAEDVALPYDWFHTKGITARGTYELKNERLVVPEFETQALGGKVSARVEMDVAALRFRAETTSQGMSLAAIIAALDHPGFPVIPLHWDAAVSADAVTTWTGEFQHLDSRGAVDWTPPAQTEGRIIPASAHIPFHFQRDAEGAEITNGWITTPTARIEMGGRLGMRDTALDMKVDAGDLLPWNDFINGLRGGGAGPRRIAGRAEWSGKVSGPLAVASFDGHLRARDAVFDQFVWDEIEGDLSYSHDHLRLQNTRARRGPSSAAINLSLTLTNWQFSDDSEWNLDVRLTREDTDGLQSLFGTSYPARGLLTGIFRGQGTRSAPVLSATFSLENLVARGTHFDVVSGELEWTGDRVHVSNGEIRKGRALARGNLTYRTVEQQIEFELSAAEVGIEDLEPLKNDRLPLAGRLQFAVRGSGPVRAPSADGKLRLTQLKVGDEVLGDFDAQLQSDGKQLSIEASSTMAAGRLNGRLQVILTGDYPMDGEITVENMDLDPFLQAALRLRELTGHSHVAGHFRFSGPLADPQRIVVGANISDINFDYEYVKLSNVGPLRLIYRSDEVRIVSAHLAGPDTDLNLSGFAHFGGDRQIAMALAGRANLRLLAGIWPQLEARGAAQVNASVEGALPRPRITGKLHVENAAASYGDFPSGLSNVTGDCVFDVNRMVFENVTAEVGGGKLTLGGSLSYGEGPLRFDLNTRAQKVRIRYPAGMSWLAGGRLRLQGTTNGALLSGRVFMERLLLLEGLDLAAVMSSARDAGLGGGTASSFLRNLQFDIEAVSSSDARVEWASARFESEAELRIRGTAEHPVLLGHVHLLSGEMDFRGNRYRLTRGDMNFSNPFRLDPMIDVEATTTIQQYEVSIQLSGPASRLTLGYRSDPPLPPSDIITLLALGHTGEESQLRTSSGGGGADLGAQALLSEAISSQLGGRVERLFGVSRFRVDPAFSGVGSDQNATARITIEQRLTRDLTVTYVTNVTSTQRQVIQIEYSVSRGLSVLGLRDENGTFGLDFKLTKRIK
jgi:translocation and assembly module TamB